MRRFALLLVGLALPALGLAQTKFPGYQIAGQTGTDRPPFDPNTPAEAQVPGLHAAWQAETDPVKRAHLGDGLVAAVMHEFNTQQPDLVDEVARDGLPGRVIAPPVARVVAIIPLTTLDGVHANEMAWPASLVFRRIADNRFEAWTSPEGWLFNSRGRLLAHVKVPRRDGGGREWYGAFLPDGTWITTDLWSEDKQLNAYDSKGKWLWELDGADIVKQLQSTNPNDPDTGEGVGKPTIGWARADRIGLGWIISIGENGMTLSALVAEGRTVAALSAGENEWDMVHPRAMGVRGMYTVEGISSDDGKLHLSREEAGHGIGVGWPNYSVTPGTWSRVIRSGNQYFGFWPKSHALFVETEGDTYDAAHVVWFFDAAGQYAGEISGKHLGDAANGRGLLVTTPDDTVTTVMPGGSGITATQSCAFAWPDGSRAVPLALYDDLHLGFFLRGEGIQGETDDARRARASADIVLAEWKG